MKNTVFDYTKNINSFDAAEMDHFRMDARNVARGLVERYYRSHGENFIMLLSAAIRDELASRKPRAQAPEHNDGNE